MSALKKRRQRFESMLEQILELYDIQKEHGVDFLKDLIYPIEDHVLQFGVLFLTRHLDPEIIEIGMKTIKNEDDHRFISFVTHAILLIKQKRKRAYLEQQLRNEIEAVFSAPSPDSHPSTEEDMIRFRNQSDPDNA